MIVDNKFNESITYLQLVQNCNSISSYYPIYSYKSLVDFIRNLILALSANQPLVIIDNDFTEAELKSYELLDDLNKPLSRNLNIFSTVDELINAIQNSNSLITIFTSGTTGVPKKVVHNVKSLTRLVKISDKYRNDRWCLAYNPSHMAGLQVIFQVILNQNYLFNIFKYETSEIHNLIQKETITHISATPTFYRMLLSVKLPLKSIKRVTLGGEKSSQKLLEQLSTFFPFAKLNNIYATTEFGSILVSKGDKFIIPTQLNDLVKLDNNELIISNLLIPNSKTNGWYRTGDMVELISDNPVSFRFIGRKNEMINVGGNKVNASEVEDCIRSINDVVDVLVYGKPNSVLGSILHAEIVIKKESDLSKNVIQDILKRSLQDFKIPRIIRIVDSIQKTRTGKISRK